MTEVWRVGGRATCAETFDCTSTALATLYSCMRQVSAANVFADSNSRSLL